MTNYSVTIGEPGSPGTRSDEHLGRYSDFQLAQEKAITVSQLAPDGLLVWVWGESPRDNGFVSTEVVATYQGGGKLR